MQSRDGKPGDKEACDQQYRQSCLSSTLETALREITLYLLISRLLFHYVYRARQEQPLPGSGKTGTIPPTPGFSLRIKV
jgi:hypothetical protein